VVETLLGPGPRSRAFYGDGLDLRQEGRDGIRAEGCRGGHVRGLRLTAHAAIGTMCISGMDHFTPQPHRDSRMVPPVNPRGLRVNPSRSGLSCGLTRSGLSTS
jgi:hypothetical protein